MENTKIINSIILLYYLFSSDFFFTRKERKEKMVKINGNSKAGLVFPKVIYMSLTNILDDSKLTL